MLTDFITDCPIASNGESFTFAAMDDDFGHGVYPEKGGGARIRRSVTGKVAATVDYPMYVVLRSGGGRSTHRASTFDTLDSIGRWLVSQTDFPELSDNRKILGISIRYTPYLAQVNDNKTEDWRLGITVTVSNNN